MNIQQMCSGDASLVPAGLRGYRMWNVSGSALTATTSVHGGWMDGHLTAECKRPPTSYVRLRSIGEQPAADDEHEAPHADCGCGIYGWYRPDEVRLHRGELFGVIEATGRVMLGDFGFRAQHARILALVVPGHVPDGRRIRDHWTEHGVAVFGDREALLAEYPPDDVVELLGHAIPDTPPVADWGQISLTMQLDVGAFQQAMVRLGQAFGRTAAQLDAMFLGSRVVPLTKMAIAEDDTHRDLTPRERALALRRERNTGPVPRARGRARLDTP